jgi:hypothetical protein
VSFKKLIFSATTLFMLFSSVSAYDTKGKFGMGIKIWGTPVILFSNMKIGVSNGFGLEPSVGFHQLKLKQTIIDYDPYGYEETEIETKFNVFMVSNIFDFKIIRKDRSNFLLRAGAGYARAMTKEEDDYEDYKTSLWSLQIKAGFGVEHFFTDHFGVYAGFLNAWGVFGSKDSNYDNVSGLSLGNQFAELSFNWYLQ